jgi:hypothetical protein
MTISSWTLDRAAETRGRRRRDVMGTEEACSYRVQLARDGMGEMNGHDWKREWKRRSSRLAD